MKKKIFCLCAYLILALNVYGQTSSFSFNSSEILNEQSKSEQLSLKFDQSYKVSSTTAEEEYLEEKELVKEATYYLLGPANNTNETAESYIKRKNAYNAMRYDPEIPLDENGELDDESDEYWDSSFASYGLSQMFKQFNDLEIVYKQFDDVRVVMNEDGFIALITLNNVEMQTADDEEPMKFKTVNANLKIYYIFKKYNDEYQMYYIYGEVDDELEKYNEEASQQEYRGINSFNEYKSSLSSLYDYSKVDALTSADIKKIYNTNKNNIVIFNTMDNQNISNAGNGFFITNDLVVTTWSYIEKSLLSGSYITALDGNNKMLNVEGIVSIDVDNDYAVLKVTGGNSDGVTFGDNPKENDVGIIISSKTGTNLSVNKGVIITVGNEITSLIPTLEYEEGAPLLNNKGEVIGMNNSEITSSYLSKAYNSKVLKELQNKFSSINEVTYITFEELKNNYYVKYGTDKVVDKIDSKVWDKYKKIGNLEENISLELIKASYKDKVLSLRYKNQLSSVFSNMQLASSFTKQLKSEGYKEIVNEAMKKVYSNDNYRVTIMSEFDYLIIVIAEI